MLVQQMPAMQHLNGHELETSNSGRNVTFAGCGDILESGLPPRWPHNLQTSSQGSSSGPASCSSPLRSPTRGAPPYMRRAYTSPDQLPPPAFGFPSLGPICEGLSSMSIPEDAVLDKARSVPLGPLLRPVRKAYPHGSDFATVDFLDLHRHNPRECQGRSPDAKVRGGMSRVCSSPSLRALSGSESPTKQSVAAIIPTSSGESTSPSINASDRWQSSESLLLVGEQRSGSQPSSPFLESSSPMLECKQHGSSLYRSLSSSSSVTSVEANALSSESSCNLESRRRGGNLFRSASQATPSGSVPEWAAGEGYFRSLSTSSMSVVDLTIPLASLPISTNRQSAYGGRKQRGGNLFRSASNAWSEVSPSPSLEDGRVLCDDGSRHSSHSAPNSSEASPADGFGFGGCGGRPLADSVNSLASPIRKISSEVAHSSNISLGQGVNS